MNSRSEPLRNRVDPWGELQAVKAYGTRMGNRGILHDEHNRIVRPWKSSAWVTCVLEATFQKRRPFSPGTYSELFFLDEATAYAAGHRPCRTCQRERHDAFNAHWTAANSPGSFRLPIRDIDARLHAERVDEDRRKRTITVNRALLPPGAMFAHDGRAFLVTAAGLRLWTFDGYQSAPELPAGTDVALLTPPSIVAAMRHGLPVDTHPSANTNP